jgi:hypothetical protein
MLMPNTVRVLPILLLLSSLFLCAGPSLDVSQDQPRELTFTAMGCGPYNAVAHRAIGRYMALENADGRSRFVVHLGDLFAGAPGKTMVLKPDRGEPTYAAVADVLSTNNRIPTFVVPGDNEWNDRLDPDVGWAL